MQSVAIDEAHEMCINREAKSTILFPTKDNLSRLTQFFPYQSTAIKNQLHIQNSATKAPHTSVHHTTLEEYKAEHDFRSLFQAIQDNRLLIVAE